MRAGGAERSASSPRDCGAWCFCWGHGVRGGSLLTLLGHTAWSCLGHVGVSTLGEGADVGMYTWTHGLTLRHPPQGRRTRVPRSGAPTVLRVPPLQPLPCELRPGVGARACGGAPAHEYRSQRKVELWPCH